MELLWYAVHGAMSDMLLALLWRNACEDKDHPASLLPDAPAGVPADKRERSAKIRSRLLRRGQAGWRSPFLTLRLFPHFNGSVIRSRKGTALQRPYVCNGGHFPADRGFYQEKESCPDEYSGVEAIDGCQLVIRRWV